MDAGTRTGAGSYSRRVPAANRRPNRLVTARPVLQSPLRNVTNYDPNHDENRSDFANKAKFFLHAAKQTAGASPVASDSGESWATSDSDSWAEATPKHSLSAFFHLSPTTKQTIDDHLDSLREHTPTIEREHDEEGLGHIGEPLEISFHAAPPVPPALVSKAPPPATAGMRWVDYELPSLWSVVGRAVVDWVKGGARLIDGCVGDGAFPAPPKKAPARTLEDIVVIVIDEDVEPPPAPVRTSWRKQSIES